MVGEFDGWTNLKTAIEGGLGAALVAEHESESGRIELRPIVPAPEPICVAAGWMGSVEPGMACRVLLEELRRAAGELE